MNSFKNIFKVFYKASPYSLYVLLVLFITFMLDQLDRFALPITSIEVAQDLKYGDKSCLKLGNKSKDFVEICSSFNKNEEL
jgi:hypothetical protein